MAMGMFLIIDGVVSSSSLNHLFAPFVVPIFLTNVLFFRSLPCLWESRKNPGGDEASSKLKHNLQWTIKNVTSHSSLFSLSLQYDWLDAGDLHCLLCRDS